MVIICDLVETLHETSLQKTKTPLLKPEIQKITPEISGDFAKNVQSHWRDIISLLPKSVGTMFGTYGKLSTAHDNIISIAVESDSTRNFLSSERNLGKIQEVFSEKFEKNIIVEFISGDEENSLSFSTSSFSTPVVKNPEISEKKIQTKTSNSVSTSEKSDIAISEMEEMLKF